MADRSVWERKLEIALDARKFEIGLFWQRSLFFWGFDAIAFGALGVLHEKSGQQDAPIEIIVACTGLLVSICWTLGNRGSRYWHQIWEEKLKACETELWGRAFTNLDPGLPSSFRWHFLGPWFRRHHFSVSKLAIAVSDYFVAIWIVLICYLTPGFIPRVCDPLVWIPLLTGVYIAYVVWATTTA